MDEVLNRITPYQEPDVSSTQLISVLDLGFSPRDGSTLLQTRGLLEPIAWLEWQTAAEPRRHAAFRGDLHGFFCHAAKVEEGDIKVIETYSPEAIPRRPFQDADDFGLGIEDAVS